MRAVVLTEYGGPEVLRIGEAPDPDVGPEEVLVRVHATALNRADLLQRTGRYPQPGPRATHEIPGLEFAGIVERVGPKVTLHKPGDRVMGLLAGGGYASLVATHERMAIPVPEGMSLEEAASIPEVFLTAYDALYPQAELMIGDTVLVHSGGSGVGTAAIQLVRAAGARALTTTGSAEKVARARALGADVAINYHTTDFREAVIEATNGRGADIILDFVGGPYLEQNLASAAPLGRIVFIGTMGGPTAPINLGILMQKRLRLFGTVLRARPLEQKIGLTQSFQRHAMPLFQNGALRPVVDRIFSFDEIAAAHEYMAANANFGKIVIRVA
ncbi:MAG: NAD(P)H-quinone oxidoreductase [Dehalococcoidia bacterium]